MRHMRQSLVRSVLFTAFLVLLMVSCASAGQILPNQGGHAYDFGGQTLQIASYLSQWYHNWAEGEDAARLKEVEDRFNVKIEFTYPTDWKAMLDDLKRKVLAGDKPFDVAFVQTPWIAKYGLQDFILPLNDVVSDDFFAAMPQIGPVNKDQQVWIGGKLLAINQPGARVILTSMMWNKSLFEREGLPDLYELYNNGEWTWDTFMEIIKKATRDLNGDGVPDQWGFGCMDANRFNYWISPYTNDAAPFREVNGKMVFTGNEPAFIEALQFGRQLYESGAFHPNNTIHGQEPDWTAGKIAIWGDYAPDSILTPMEDDFGTIPQPKGPRADDYASVGSVTHCIIMPLNQDKPQAVLEVVNALYGFTEPYVDKDTFTEEFWDKWAADKGNALRDFESVDIYRQMVEKVEMPLDPAFILPKAYNSAIQAVLKGDKTAAAAMQEIAPEMQAYLDDTFNK